MAEVLILDAVRTAIGRRNGTLAKSHANDVLGAVQRAIIERTGIDPINVDQIVGGCVQQVGAQSANVTRNAWLAMRLPQEVPAATVNSQCGSSQEANMVAHALVGSGLAGVAISCGVEMMSSIPFGAMGGDGKFGAARDGTYTDVYEATTQFDGAERIAAKWGITRQRADELGCESQRRAAVAWAEDRFARQIVPLKVATHDEDGEPDGTVSFERDEGLRATTLEGLAGLRTNQPDGIHTAGSDPELMLEGPIPATRKLLERSKLSIDDIDVFEINEAFASVVLAWQYETGADMSKVNPNGGAIAVGHPLGGSGAILLTRALYELERTGGRYALISMCCGGGLGTGTIIERL
jgi:acetyl-CoA C-acetyltransferase